MIPERIPIKRMEDYHTHFIGKIEDGRHFFGYETFIFPNGIPTSNWEKHRMEYIILHFFDKDGNHLNTNHWFAGTTSESSELQRSKKLKQMIRELGDIKFVDIEVKPFHILIDGIIFGLIPNEELEIVELHPGSTITFHEPWDGEYDT